MIELIIDPVAKPRMTRSDRWKHRPIVDKYFAFKTELTCLCQLKEFELPDKFRVEFFIRIPDSWSKKKQRLMYGKPHQQRPDLDNLLKSVNDCLKKEDSTIYYVEALKTWWDEGKIIFYNK